MTLRFGDIDPGRKADIARALSRIEETDGTVRHAGFLDEAARAAGARVIGLTGPPGVGKSTLTNRLVKVWRKAGLSVAVIAVDPSSRLTGGALLGDRTRLTTDPDDTGVFVRSFAARDRLGGLSDHAVAAIRIVSAFFDRVLVESVGIGQSESDLAFAVDTTILCVQPGSGDSLQFMKAGIMELPDIVAVTKADMGRDARRALADVEGALSLGPDDRTAEVLMVSSETGEGIDGLVAACDRHADALRQEGRLARRRAAQARYWYRDAIRRRFGEWGLADLDDPDFERGSVGLYAAIAETFTRLADRAR
ncbi:MAG: methylmalonyl Co-A mutase-associated GTPase MeaB [Pseudomonadota bacterium]